MNLVYHGSPTANLIEDLRSYRSPVAGGELGEGLYFSKWLKDAADYDDRRSEDGPSPHRGVLAILLGSARIKEISKQDFLEARRVLYDDEQKKNGGEWVRECASRAEARLIDSYLAEGYDGLHVAEERQGVVFKKSLDKLCIDRRIWLTDWRWATSQTVLDLPFVEGVPSPEKAKTMSKWIKQHSDRYENKLVKMYHATDPSIPVLSEGLKPTSATRRRSYQSESGYVYLANTPERARNFGDLGNQGRSIVYEVVVLVRKLKADKDQLCNQRAVGHQVGDSIGESIIYGGGVRVEGTILPWQISPYSIDNELYLSLQQNKRELNDNVNQREEESLLSKIDPELLDVGVAAAREYWEHLSSTDDSAALSFATSLGLPASLESESHSDVSVSHQAKVEILAKLAMLGAEVVKAPDNFSADTLAWFGQRGEIFAAMKSFFPHAKAVHEAIEYGLGRSAGTPAPR